MPEAKTATDLESRPSPAQSGGLIADDIATTITTSMMAAIRDSTSSLCSRGPFVAPLADIRGAIRGRTRQAKKALVRARRRLYGRR
jgi:hypothetical protein